MQFSLFKLSILLAVPVAVSACEGECIVGITDAFLGNYTTPIHSVFQTIGDQIVQKLIPNHARTTDPITYLGPLIVAYTNMSYATLEDAVFPGYFHGKCQQNGVDPVGCPNPDCPIVCGTPGSLVHYYTKLREIVFDTIQKMMQTLSEPGSEAYRKVEQMVMEDARQPTRRMLRMYARKPASSLVVFRRADNSIENGLKEIMAQIPDMLEKSCGGTVKGLPQCSWETSMKSYILSFP